MIPRPIPTCAVAALALASVLATCPAADYVPEPSASTLSTPSTSPDEPARTWAAPGTTAPKHPSGHTTADDGAHDTAVSKTANGEPPTAKPRSGDHTSRRRDSPRPSVRTAAPPAPPRASATVAAPRTSDASPRGMSEEATASGEAMPHPQAPDPDRAAPALFAEQPNDATRKPAGGSPSQSPGTMAGMLVGLGLKLGLVITLAYLCALAVRKVAQRRGAVRIGRGVLRVVESAALAPNRGLHIVAVGNRAFLVGSTPEQFSVLGEVSDVAEVMNLTEAERTSGTLADRLRQWLGRQAPGAASRDPLIERVRAGAQSLRERATQSAPRFDKTLQAAIDEASRR